MDNTALRHIAFVGEVDAGKSALINMLIDQQAETGKTQAPIFYPGQVIDTPGEFIENRSWNGALLSTIAAVKTIVVLQPANAKRFSAPSGLLHVYPNKQIVGVISKVDETDSDTSRAASLLQQNGIKGPYLETSIHDPDSIARLFEYLITLQPEVRV